jgi:hypothetical protein
MFLVTPDERKRFRARANSGMRKLRKEEASGYIGDGGGNRYRVGPYFLLAGDLEKAAEAFEWFDQTFAGQDSGEPIFFLCGALTAYRQGEWAKARLRLVHAMLGNIFLLPFFWGEQVDATGVWFFSNRAERSYLATVREFLDEPTPEEREWMASEWNSRPFAALRKGYLSTFRALDKEPGFARRDLILRRWLKLQAKQFAKLER